MDPLSFTIGIAVMFGARLISVKVWHRLHRQPPKSDDTQLALEQELHDARQSGYRTVPLLTAEQQVQIAKEKLAQAKTLHSKANSLLRDADLHLLRAVAVLRADLKPGPKTSG